MKSQSREIWYQTDIITMQFDIRLGSIVMLENKHVKLIAIIRKTLKLNL